jgi:hypothetical protein
MSFIMKIASHIRALHIHENDGLQDTHEPVREGSWVVDLLHQREFREVPLIIEAKFQNPAALRMHVEWLLNEVG